MTVAQQISGKDSNRMQRLHKQIRDFAAITVLTASIFGCKNGKVQNDPVEVGPTLWVVSDEEQTRLNYRLLACVSRGDLEGVKDAIDKGAEVNTKLADVNAFSSYENGQKHNDQLARINYTHLLGYTPLLLAISGNRKDSHTDMIKFLISKGADVNQVCCGGLTPLMKAAATSPYNSQEHIELLLSKGADVNAKTDFGKTALGWANKPVGELLISKGADVHVKLDDGTSLLMLAVRHGDKEVVELLISKRVDVNAINNEGKSALIIALEGENADMARLLLSKGANVNVRSKDGNTPLRLAKEGFSSRPGSELHYEGKIYEEGQVREKIVKLLRASGAKD